LCCCVAAWCGSGTWGRAETRSWPAGGEQEAVKDAAGAAHAKRGRSARNGRTRRPSQHAPAEGQNTASTTRRSGQ